MENNYKEFIQKIKYMVEYDTSKTREENTLLTEGEEVTKKIWDGMSDDEREEALLTVFSDPDDAAKWIEAKYDDLPPQATHMEINEGVITEEDTPKLKGIEEAQKIINKIRAKHKNA